MAGLPDKKTIIQFFKFGIVGTCNTAISLAIYFLFIYIDKDLYLLGNLIGWIISVANAFFWNYKFVFEDTESSFRKLVLKIGKTYLSYGGTLVISSILLFIEISVFDWPPGIGPLANLILTIPVNFLLNKYWTFQK